MSRLRGSMINLLDIHQQMAAMIVSEELLPGHTIGHLETYGGQTKVLLNHIQESSLSYSSPKYYYWISTGPPSRDFTHSNARAGD